MSLVGFFAVLIILFSLFLLKYHIILNREIRLIRVPPGPIALPYVGCLPQVLMNKPTFRWIHNLMEQMNTEILRIRIGKTNVYTITSPQIAGEFLKQHDAIFASRPKCMAADLISGGYLTTAVNPFGDQWKKMRRIVASELLSTPRFGMMHDKRVEEADHLVRYVYNQRGGVVNVRLATQHYCGNVIRKVVFGTRFFGKGMKDGGPGCEELEHVGAMFTIHQYLY